MNCCGYFGRRCRDSAKQLYFFSALRNMGGGPRTFPGGINKWQWKRLHEKRAMQKERRLIDQEKQIYQARLRSQIREKFVRGSKTLDQDDDSLNCHDPMSSRDHLKGLADRFMKDGAEDLWNEDDGPLKPSSAPQSLNNRSNLTGKRSDFGKDSRDRSFMSFGSSSGRRFYSVEARRSCWRDGNSSSDDDDDSFEFVSSPVVSGSAVGGKKQPRFRLSGGKSSEADEGGGGRRGLRKLSDDSSGKYGIIKKKRISLNLLEKECDPADDIELIKQQLSERKMEEDCSQTVFHNSIFTQKRFDESGISPLTVKALTEAKYLYLSKVQEASLPACLEGHDAMIKAKTGTGKSIAFLF